MRNIVVFYWLNWLNRLKNQVFCGVAVVANRLNFFLLSVKWVKSGGFLWIAKKMPKFIGARLLFLSSFYFWDALPGLLRIGARSMRCCAGTNSNGTKYRYIQRRIIYIMYSFDPFVLYLDPGARMVRAMHLPARTRAPRGGEGGVCFLVGHLYTCVGFWGISTLFVFLSSAYKFVLDLSVVFMVMYRHQGKAIWMERLTTMRRYC